ncbi:hypothetical protein CA850_29705 [Micromonospora echinospora]|uniref:Uncharacterized protein n=1 Tax=Micromonospora echinospora TaxID=1877 RepID=A0A1C5ABH7_MICEC|nr:hypothetical protein [Micromonospora echinospora]OZV74756.1 hypothetical protein CA850_29705 [Micromonospora echinospora]SCF42431.1 hypothetical protein GA0070618_6659 [Micromonospora echinospora]
MMATATRDELAAALVRALRALRRGEVSRERKTQLYREAAEATFALREHFDVGKDGKPEPDWSGRSREYREFIRSLYVKTGYDRDDAKTVQTAIRFHVGNLVRDRLSPEVVEDLGLKPEHATDRMKDYRRVRSAVVATARESASSGNPDALRALAAAHVVLSKVSTAEVAALSGREREQARAVLARLKDHAGWLAAAAEEA